MQITTKWALAALTMACASALVACSDDNVEQDVSIKFEDNSFSFKARNEYTKYGSEADGDDDVDTRKVGTPGSGSIVNGNATGTTGGMVQWNSNEIMVLPGDIVEISYVPTHNGEKAEIVTPDGNSFHPTVSNSSYYWRVPDNIQYGCTITGQTTYTADDVTYVSNGKIFVREDLWRKAEISKQEK